MGRSPSATMSRRALSAPRAQRPCERLAQRWLERPIRKRPHYAQREPTPVYPTTADTWEFDCVSCTPISPYTRSEHCPSIPDRPRHDRYPAVSSMLRAHQATDRSELCCAHQVTPCGRKTCARRKRSSKHQWRSRQAREIRLAAEWRVDSLCIACATCAYTCEALADSAGGGTPKR